MLIFDEHMCTVLILRLSRVTVHCANSVCENRLQRVYSRKPRLSSVAQYRKQYDMRKKFITHRGNDHSALRLSFETIFTPIDFQRVSH